MKKLIVLFLSISLSASSQKFSWAKEFVGTTNSVSEKVVVDKNKNIYTIGKFSGIMDFNPSPAVAYTVASNSSGIQEPFICKLDSNGNFLWVRNWQINNVSNYGSIDLENLNIDDQGNIYVLGSFFRQQDLNPSISSTYTVNSNSNVIGCSFIIKLNSFGNFIWASVIGETGPGGSSNSYMSDLCIDKSNNIIFARAGLGSFYYEIGTSSTLITSNRALPVFLFKINSNGQLQYYKEYGKIKTYPYGGCDVLKLRVNADNNNNVFITGEYESGNSAPNQIDFNGDFVISSTNSAQGGFLIKYNATGNYQYAYKTASGNLHTNILPNNEIILLSESPKQFGYGTLSSVYSNLVPIGTSQNYNIFTLSKIDNNSGILTFSKNLFIGPAFGNAQNLQSKVRFDNKGNTYISVFGTGGQGNSGLMDLTQSTYSISIYNNPYHLVNNSGLVKVDSLGRFVLATNAFNNGNDFSVDNSQNVYFTGMCNHYNNIPDLSPDGIYNTSNGYPFVTKLAFCEAARANLTGPQAFCLNQQSFDYIKLKATGGPGIQNLTSQPGLWLNNQPNTTNIFRDSSRVYSSGVFSVVVNNACGYASKDTDNVRVFAYPLINADANTLVTASCLGGANGSFSINPSGGKMPFIFNLGGIPLNSIMTNSSSASASNLSTGIYTLQVTDQNNCYHIMSVNIPTVQALQVSVTKTATCYGNDGKIKLISALSDTTYIYQWNIQGQTTNSISNLGLGVYSFTVTDQNPFSPNFNCKFTNDVTIGPPVNTTVTSNVYTTCDTPVYIFGNSDSPIQYQWNPTFGVSQPNSLNTLIQTTHSQQYVLTTTDGACVKMYPVNVHVNYPSNFAYVTSNMSVTFNMTDMNYCSTNGYTWDFGNGMQNNVATNPSVTYASPGLYTACLKCGNVPQACIACKTFSLPSNSIGSTDVSVFEYVNNIGGFKYYPNPNNGNFYIEAENEVIISITNVLGETILTQKLQAGRSEIKLNNQTSGIYFINALSSTFKLIID